MCIRDRIWTTYVCLFVVYVANEVGVILAGLTNNFITLSLIHILYWIYENAFSYYRVGPAMAGAVVLLMLVGSISVLVFTISNRKAHY